MVSAASLGNPLFLIKARMQVRLRLDKNSSRMFRMFPIFSRPTLQHFQLALNIITRTPLTPFRLYFARKEFVV